MGDPTFDGASHANWRSPSGSTNFIACLSRSLAWHCEFAKCKKDCRLSLSLSPCSGQYDLANSTLGDDSHCFSIGATDISGRHVLIRIDFCTLVHSFQCLGL